MNWKQLWERPVLLAGLLLCGASLGVDQTQAAPSANLDQTRNGKFDDPKTPPPPVGIDVNGNAGFQNSHYLEGHSIPYRCVMSDLPPNTEITIRLGFDIRHSSRNALDYLTGYQLLDPHTQFGHPCEAVNPTVGTSLFEDPATPDSELTIATPNATIPANSFDKLPIQTIRDDSKNKMSLWGGTLKTIQYVDDSASWNAKLGDDISQIQIDVTFTTGSGSVAILSWAGHIASRANWGFDANGVPNSAGGISGSPYHMALISWSLGNIGQQDRSLKADAVIIPPTCDVTGDSKCIGQTATLTVTPHTQVGGFGDPYSFKWSKTLNADGSLGTIISTSQALSIPNVQLSDDGTYYARVFDKSAISSVACNGVLSVYPNPVAAVGPPQAACEDDDAGPGHTFTSLGGQAQNGTPKWTVASKNPAGLVVTFGNENAANTSAKLSGAGTATVRLTVSSTSNPSCGQDYKEVALTVYPEPVAVAGPPQAACEDGDAGPGHTFTALGGQAQNGTPKWTVVSRNPAGLVVTFGNENAANTSATLSGAGSATVRLTVTSTSNPSCGQDYKEVVLTVYGPAIACGPECADGAALLVFHRLDGDAQGGAAIVNDSAVGLETFPSGSDISYEPFDKFAVLGLAPGQVTTTQIEIPICNKGAVPLEKVHLTFYKGNIAREQSPEDCVTVPDGTPFDGNLGVGQTVTLQYVVQVQCGTVPITVSGTSTAAYGACAVESSCSVEVECIEVFCRTTGGGRQDPGPTTLLQVKSGNTLVIDTSAKFTTHGGQMRGRQTIPLSAADILSSGSPDICGQWQHVRHANGGRLQSFHTAGIFDSLRCACLACDSLTPLSNTGLCNPEDRVCGPEPRRANANAIAVTGVGKMALSPGKKDTDVVFRIYIEDRGEPGGSPFGHPEDPPDVYCIQIWIVNSSPSGALRASISGWLGTGVPAGAPAPDISDCGDLSRGNHQLHPVKNLNCP